MTRETTRAGRWAFLATLAALGTTLACASGNAKTAAAAPMLAGGHLRQVRAGHDLITRDAAACRKFYGALLGWDFRQTTREGRPYLIARSDGGFTGGIVQLVGDQTGPAAWLSYLSVADLDRATAQVGAAGGKVLLQPRSVEQSAASRS